MIRRGLGWLRRELFNRRDPIGYARSLGVNVGEDCEFFGTTHATWGTEPYLITLGRRVMVTAGVRFINHDGAVLVFRREYPDLDLVAPIVVGDNVFIGVNAIILRGVTIGPNAVIGAASVVNRDIPSGVVAAGVPARPICTIGEWFRKHESQFIQAHRLPDDEKRLLFLERYGKR